MAEKLEGKTVKLQDANGSVILPRTLAKNVQMADGVNDLENTIAKVRQDMEKLSVGDVSGALEKYAKKEEVAEKVHKHLAADVVVVEANVEQGQAEVTVAGALDAKADKTALQGLASEQFVTGKIADLVGGAPETLDTLKEVADALVANKSTVEALQQVAGSKADRVHTHADLEAAIAGKANIVHTHEASEVKVDAEKSLAVAFQEVLNRLASAENSISVLLQSIANANAKIATLETQMETVLQGKPDQPTPTVEAPVLLGMAKVYHEGDASNGVAVSPEEVCNYSFLVETEGSEVQKLTKKQLVNNNGVLTYIRTGEDSDPKYTHYMCLCLFVPIAYGQIESKVINGSNIDEIDSYQQGTCTLTINGKAVNYGYLIRKVTQSATKSEKSTFSVALAK